MEQFIFHCNAEYLNFLPEQRWFRKQKDWWFLLEPMEQVRKIDRRKKMIGRNKNKINKQVRNRECQLETVKPVDNCNGRGYLHIHLEKNPPKLQIIEKNRAGLYQDFYKSVGINRPYFERVYGIGLKYQQDFDMTEAVSENANQLMLIESEPELSQKLTDKMLWENGLIVEQYNKFHFFRGDKSPTALLFFSDHFEGRIPYKDISSNSHFIEFGTGEKAKRGIYQKSATVKYESLYGFLDNTVKNRYNSLVNMGILNQYQIKI